MGVSGQRHASAAFYRGERIPGTHLTEGGVDLRGVLDTEAREQILCLCRGKNPVVKSVVRQYTD
jgi:hypothetical protein